MKTTIKWFLFSGVMVFALSCAGEPVTVSATTPDTPTGLTATVSDGLISLSWQPALNATGYKVYWSTTPGVTISNASFSSNSIGTTFNHYGINGTTYHFIVTATNEVWNSNGVYDISESLPTAEISATPGTPPLAPMNVSATGGNSQVTVSWDPVIGADSYNLYWSNTDGVTAATGTKIANVTSPYIHTNLTNGLNYYYMVTAQSNAYGEGIGSSTASPAIPVSLDTTFNSTGYVSHNSAAGGNGSDYGNALAIQPDGKIVVVGSSMVDSVNNSLAIWRYNTDGSLDTTFNTTGYHTIAGGEGHGVALQGDGKIVVTGSGWNGTNSSDDMILCRFNTDGTVDFTFGTIGCASYAGALADVGNSVSIQADGKLVVTGSINNNLCMATWRYDTTGSLDTTFNGTGSVTFSGTTSGGYSNAIQADGKIVVAGNAFGAGQDMALWRYNSDGTVDTTFNSVGYVLHDTTGSGSNYDSAKSLVIQSNGAIVVTGERQTTGDAGDMVIWRFNANGTLDTTFNSSGYLVYNGPFNGIANSIDAGHSVALQNDGKILIAGHSEIGGTLWRYNPDGLLDTTFNSTGIIHTAPLFWKRAVKIQADGKIVTTGDDHNISWNYDMTVWRYIP